MRKRLMGTMYQNCTNAELDMMRIVDMGDGLYVEHEGKTVSAAGIDPKLAEYRRSLALIPDKYKDMIKTFREITKLERNGMFVYESVPGTVVHDFRATDKAVNFVVEGEEDSQITLELEAEKEYKIHIDKVYVGKMKTNLGGKLNLSVELEPAKMVDILVEKI